MTNPRLCLSLGSGLRRAVVALAMTWVLTMLSLQAAQAQSFSVVHNFGGGLDGANPYAGLTVDRAGNFYGTTYAGGSSHLGTVYRLKRSGSSWIADGLYSFRGGPNDGAEPVARVIFGPDGSLYGTTSIGDSCGALGCGIVFKLQPPASFCRSVSCPWTETVLHFFAGYPSDGEFASGELVFDQAGNLYGTTNLGGGYGGVLYQMTRSGNSWTESIVHNFSSADGYEPYGGLISDTSGNLYGTTQTGGMNYSGTVFQFTHAGSGWTETVPYNFQLANGGAPTAGMVFDGLGNLYGATSYGGRDGAGVVYELSPSGGGWTYSLLYNFAGPDGCSYDQYIGAGPWAALTVDAAGNLYGTTRCNGAHQMGNVFKLTNSAGSWTYTSLHDFTGGDDGAYPLSNVMIDGSGNLYGTASGGGTGTCLNGCGVVWEITP